MKRIIRFRSWDKKEKLMLYSRDVEFSASEDVDQDLCEINTFFGRISGENSKDNFELMQFTGLFDKNGTEIYEGDIVEVPMPGLTYDIMSVEWKRVGKDEGWMVCKNGKGLYPLSWDLRHKRTQGLLNDWDDRTSIIGNIYENSELIKNK